MKTSVPVHPGKINIDVLAVSRVVCQSGAFYKSRLEKLLIVLSWAKQFLFPSRITSFNKRLLSINFDPLTRSKVSSGEQQFIRAEKQFSFLMSSKIIPTSSALQLRSLCRPLGVLSSPCWPLIGQ